MVDIQSLSDKPDALVCAIGAVAFNSHSGELGETFYHWLDWDDQHDRGREINPSTVRWWLTKGSETS
jgi:hypothetical protein